MAPAVIYSQQVNIRKEPVNLKQEDRWLFDLESYTSPKSEICKLKNTLITSEGVILKNLTLVKENITCYESDFTNYEYKYIIKSLLLYKKHIPKFEKPAIIFYDNYSDFFAHWVIDAMTRMIEVQELIPDHTVILPPYINRFPFHRQTLELFGVKDEYVIPRTSLIYLKDVLLPTHLAPSGHFNNKNIDKLRSFVLDKIKSSLTMGRNIYISRKRATRRFVLNEDKVSVIMKNYGFIEVCMEDYTFDEQVSLVSSATNVVAIHGAALAAIAFMKPDSNVLEFRKENDNHNNVFYNLACAADVNYYYLQCKAENISPAANNFNLEVDTASLILVLTKMLS